MLFKIDPALNKKETPKNLKSFTSKVIVCNKASIKKAMTLIGAELQNWQLKELKDKSKSKLTGKSGPVWYLRLDESKNDTHSGLLNESAYATAREQMGSLINEILAENAKEMKIEFLGLEKEEMIGALVGMELALYRFEGSKKLGKLIFTHNGKKLAAAILTEAKAIAVAINQARHLVNLPPNELNPVTYAKEIKKLYLKSKTIKVSVYDEKKLAKEKCGLLLSVGNSSNNPPRIVHMKYRPAGAKGKTTALVGKGLTFDSGGLDIKSAAGMRLMKKDMGGSATLLGFSRWLETSKVKKNIDIYLALAENSISENSSRPSDIFTARNGMKIEIHNTDAEGRLALADAIDLALDAKPDVLIDVATLTGAGKVALGQDIASLFANDDKLANDLLAASQKMGDLAWRMPLYNPYMKGLNSDFADMTNAAAGHGGAITAALFLEKFVGKTKWAHLDIFGWTSSTKPSLVQKGGSGQAVETLIGYFS